MTEPAPIDPAADAVRRAQSAAGQRRYLVTLAVFTLQGVLSLVAGAWAARVADDGSGTIGLYAGVASAFAFAGAVGAAYVFRMTAGTVLGLMGLPGILRKITASPPPAPVPPDPADRRRAFLLHLCTAGVHTVVLLVLFLVVAAGVALAGPAGFPLLAARFALAAALLSLLTWRSLQLPW